MNYKLNLTKKTLFLLISTYILFLTFLVLIKNTDIYGDEPEVAESAINIILAYKDILSGNWSVLEPHSYLYGTIYTYLLAVLGFPIYKIVSLLSIYEINHDFFYIIFRLFNLAILLYSVFFLIEIFRTLNKEQKISYYLAFLWVANPLFAARSQFINQDALAITLYLGSFSFFLKSLQKEDLKNLFLYLIFSGLAISAKITYILPFLCSAILYLSITRKIKKILLFIIIPFISYIISYPYALINWGKYFNRMIELGTLEAGISLDSHNLDYLFYIERSFYFLIPIVLLVIFFLATEKTTISGFIQNNKSLLLLSTQLISLLAFFSIQVRKMDRWGLPIYLLIYLLVFLILTSKERNQRSIKYIFIINIIYLAFLSLPIFNFFLNQDPRFTLKEYITKNSEKTFLVITEHGNNSGLQNLDNTTILSHRLYESRDDIEEYKPNNNIKNFDYLVISNGVIRDFNNRHNLNKYKSIQEWKKLIKDMRKEKVIGAEKILYEPQIGFTIYSLEK